jgi:enamine deaminase RidA (YjgF/YER057c/UK114 family)
MTLGTATAAVPRFLNPEGLAAPLGYSHLGIAKGSLVFVAGQVAINAAGETVGAGDFGAQAEQVLANLERALEGAGATFSSVVNLTIFCTQAVDRGQLRELGGPFRKRIGNAMPPASTLIFVGGLMNPDWLIEIQAVAMVKS